MIQSKNDYHFYLEADRLALDITRQRPRIIGDDIWKFERLLRKFEYFINCKHDVPSRLYCSYLRYRFYKMGLKLGYLIPPNVFGPGLGITFLGPILVNPAAKIGADCRISHCVTIGRSNKSDTPPSLGDNVFIGPGAVIVGPIEIADGIAIGANSYVDKSFKEKGITIAGAPARKISDRGSDRVIREASRLVSKDLNKQAS
jgi:serine O-acetyltransferase